MTLGRTACHRLEQIARGRSEEGLHLLEGPKAVADALAAGHVVELYLAASLPEAVAASLRGAAEAADVPVQTGGDAAFRRLSRTVRGQGVLALVADTAVALEVVLAAQGLLLWLDGLQDPGNVGAVVRVAAAFGAAGLLVTEGTADPLGTKALRASAGLALGLPFARARAADVEAGLAATPRALWLLEAGGDDVRDLGAVPDDLLLVVGGEGHGPGPVARRLAARTVGIPLAGGVDSLNAAVAAGVAVSHLVRRKRS